MLFQIKRPIPALLLALVMAAPASGAFAKKLSLKDELTVSGRFNLPVAQASLHQASEVKTALQTDEATRELTAKTLKLKPELLDDMLLKAFSKSLANYGYVMRRYNAPDSIKPNANGNALQESESDVTGETPKTPITLKINSVTFDENDDGLVSTVSMSMDSPKACLKAETNAKYLALKLKETEGGRKVFAFVAVVAMAAITESVSDSTGSRVYNTTASSLFLNGQLNEAEHLNKIKTYGTETAFGESYPPKRGKNTAKRHALKNAIRLNFARYITLIDQACS